MGVYKLTTISKVVIGWCSKVQDNIPSIERFCKEPAHEIAARPPWIAFLLE